MHVCKGETDTDVETDLRCYFVSNIDVVAGPFSAECRQSVLCRKLEERIDEDM